MIFILKNKQHYKILTKVHSMSHPSTLLIKTYLRKCRLQHVRFFHMSYSPFAIWLFKIVIYMLFMNSDNQSRICIFLQIKYCSVNHRSSTVHMRIQGELDVSELLLITPFRILSSSCNFSICLIMSSNGSPGLW